MAQVSQELIDLLTVEANNAQITNIMNAIEADKLLDGNSYTLEGEGNDKSTTTATK